ncbi:DNA repair protein RecO [Lichenibacterium dinghuense]|uniref:DNA repair protein RecO n=1 Tax=Lichenibacterium dinghuense TaxID=2895977 RepID=UPI001F02B12C|nr:DNA repair protein RecO [Lichenibacterium sp. 6Y81]
MEWRDRGTVLGGRAYGETSVVLELLTAEHGRHLGLVQGGRSRRLRPVLQPGNAVEAVWRARIDHHLGAFAVEGLKLRAAGVMGSAASLHAVNHLTGLARLLPEREPQPALHLMLEAMMEGIEDRHRLPLQMVQFELAFLAALGFGLDLAACATTGGTADLHYVSPKTGRAVSVGAAGIYADRLLPLPAFLRPGEARSAVTVDDLAAAFRLTDHFLARDVYAPRHVAPPSSRRAYLAAIAASGEGAS